MVEQFENHGISVAYKKSPGSGITAVGPTIIALMCKVSGVDDEKSDWKVLNSNSEVDEILTQLSKNVELDPTELFKAKCYLNDLLSESQGKTLVKLVSEYNAKNLQDFEKAYMKTGFKPDLIVAPEIDASQHADLFSATKNLYCTAVVDVEETQTLNSVHSNLFGVYGSHKIASADAEVELKMSAATAGLIRRIDGDRGYWVSPSNKVYAGVNAAENIVQFTFPGSPTDEANSKYNKQNISCLIYHKGVRLWGNRTASGDFITEVRTRNVILEKVKEETTWAIDEPISASLVYLLTETLKNFLADLKQSGAILYGTAEAVQAKNPPEKLKKGKISIDITITPSYPAEQISYELRVTDQGLEEIFKGGE